MTYIDLEEGKYNARDVLGMCRAYPHLAAAVEQTNTVPVYEADRAMAYVALQMRLAGMPVDLVEKERVGAHLREIQQEGLKELKKYTEGEFREPFIDWVAQFLAAKPRKNDPAAGKPTPDGTVYSEELAMAARVVQRREGFVKVLDKYGPKFGAKVQQAAILRAAGVPLLKMSQKTKLPKVDKEVLEENSHHAAARAMLHYTLTSSALRTFIDGLQIDPDGRIRPHWSIHKITGRWGSSPNVQNWSKRAGGGAENLRRMIAAPPGYIFVGADQKQLEARLIAAASGDAFLCDVFRRNADIHSELAGVAFPYVWPDLAATFKAHKGTQCGPSKEEAKCDVCKQRDKVRDLTKRLEYGAFYGGKAETLWKSVIKDFPDIKLAAINEFLNTVGTKMIGVINWRQAVLKQAIEQGEVRSPILGRREVFPMGRVEPTVAYNYVPQSGGADLWALGAVDFCGRWDQTADEARLIHNGHDSVLILTKEEHVPQVEKDVHECWEREWNGVPFLMDCKVGHRWSEV